MMANISRLQWITGLCIFIMLIFIAIDTDARGRGGGGRSVAGMSRGGHSGGFSRSSASSHGSFSGRSASRQSGGRSSSGDRSGQDRAITRADRPDRGDNAKNRQNDRQDAAKDRQDSRQDAARDIHDDREDWYDDRRRRRVATAIVIGTVISAASWNAMTCAQTSIVVDGVTYYSCGDAWYQPTYSGGSVTYVVVNAPPGY